MVFPWLAYVLLHLPTFEKHTRIINKTRDMYFYFSFFFQNDFKGTGQSGPSSSPAALPQPQQTGQRCPRAKPCRHWAPVARQLQTENAAASVWTVPCRRQPLPSGQGLPRAPRGLVLHLRNPQHGLTGNFPDRAWQIDTSDSVDAEHRCVCA